MIKLGSAQSRFSLIFLTAVYVFGVIGICSPLRDWFVAMTPFSLLLSYVVMLLFHVPHTRTTFAFFLIAYLIGFGIEVVGVNTGWPFGHYVYGKVLGPKLRNTPLMIGVNWTLITYCSYYFFDGIMPKRLPLWVFVIIAPFLPTLLDYVIEPVAIHFGMWSWPSTVLPPVQNYIGWYGTALLLAVVWRFTMPSNLYNRAAGLLLVLQVLFFAALNLLSNAFQ